MHNGHCARYECAYQAQPETKGICYHKDNRSPDDGDTEPLLCANIQTASECSNMGCQRSDYQKIKISTQLVCKDALGNTLPESACDRTQALKTLQQCNQRKCEQSTNTDPKSTGICMRADRKSGSLCEQVNTLWGSRLKVDIDELCNNTAIFTKHCVANEEHCKEYYSFLPSESLFYTEDGFPTPFYQSPRGPYPDFLDPRYYQIMGNSFAADFQETLQVKYKMQCAWQPRYVHRCYQGNKIVDDSLCATIPKPTCGTHLPEIPAYEVLESSPLPSPTPSNPTTQGGAISMGYWSDAQWFAKSHITPWHTNREQLNKNGSEQVLMLEKSSYVRKNIYSQGTRLYTDAGFSTPAPNGVYDINRSAAHFDGGASSWLKSSNYCYVEVRNGTIQTDTHAKSLKCGNYTQLR